MVRQVSLGKIREPPAQYVVEHCPAEFRVDGFTSKWVVEYFQDMKCVLPSWVDFPAPEAAAAETEPPNAAAAEAESPDATVSADLTVGTEVYFVQDIPDRRWVDGSWQTGVVAQLGDIGCVTMAKLYQQECLNRVQVRVRERTIDTLYIHVCALDSPEVLLTAHDQTPVQPPTEDGEESPAQKSKLSRKHYNLQVWR